MRTPSTNRWINVFGPVKPFFFIPLLKINDNLQIIGLKYWPSALPYFWNGQLQKLEYSQTHAHGIEYWQSSGLPFLLWMVSSRNLNIHTHSSTEACTLYILLPKEEGYLPMDHLSTLSKENCGLSKENCGLSIVLLYC